MICIVAIGDVGTSQHSSISGFCDCHSNEVTHSEGPSCLEDGDDCNAAVVLTQGEPCDCSLDSAGGM